MRHEREKRLIKYVTTSFIDMIQITSELHFEDDNIKLNKIKARISWDEKCDIQDFKRCFILYILEAIFYLTTSVEVKKSI